MYSYAKTNVQNSCDGNNVLAQLHCAVCNTISSVIEQHLLTLINQSTVFNDHKQSRVMREYDVFICEN